MTEQLTEPDFSFRIPGSTFMDSCRDILYLDVKRSTVPAGYVFDFCVRTEDGLILFSGHGLGGDNTETLTQAFQGLKSAIKNLLKRIDEVRLPELDEFKR